jgi:hypothetical protein
MAPSLGHIGGAILFACGPFEPASGQTTWVLASRWHPRHKRIRSCRLGSHRLAHINQGTGECSSPAPPLKSRSNHSGRLCAVHRSDLRRLSERTLISRRSQRNMLATQICPMRRIATRPITLKIRGRKECLRRTRIRCGCLAALFHQ